MMVWWLVMVVECGDNTRNMHYVYEWFRFTDQYVGAVCYCQRTLSLSSCIYFVCITHASISSSKLRNPLLNTCVFVSSPAYRAALIQFPSYGAREDNCSCSCFNANAQIHREQHINLLESSIITALCCCLIVAATHYASQRMCKYVSVYVCMCIKALSRW